MKLKFTIFLLVIFMFFGVAGYDFSKSTGFDSLSITTTDAYAASTSSVMVVDEFIRVYNKNPSKASKKYSGKTIQLRGYVVEPMTEVRGGDKDNAYYIRIATSRKGGKQASVRCVFTSKEKKALKSLRQGQLITVKGKVTDPNRRGGNPGLRKASIKR